MIQIAPELVQRLGLPPEGGVVHFDKAFCQQLGFGRRENPWPTGPLRQIVDEMSIRSARAQRLNVPVTELGKVIAGIGDEKLYLQIIDDMVTGLLKTGKKRLYVSAPNKGALQEITPRCVLDFYVAEQCQRAGFGIALFTEMMRKEKIGNPAKFAYDRPSPKLMKFLIKHFHLKDYESQVNHFVVFKRFFTEANWDPPPAPEKEPSPNRQEESLPEQYSSSMPEDEKVNNPFNTTGETELPTQADPLRQESTLDETPYNNNNNNTNTASEQEGCYNMLHHNPVPPVGTRAAAAAAAANAAGKGTGTKYVLRAPWAASTGMPMQSKQHNAVPTGVPAELQKDPVQVTKSQRRLSMESRMSIEERQHQREMEAIEKEMKMIQMQTQNQNFSRGFR